MITNPQSGTRVDEVAPAVYRIATPVTILPGGFSFNQYLLVDEQPLLFHTGPRRMFPLVREAIASRDAGRAPALRRLLARRGGRVRLAQRAARGGAAGRAAVRQHRGDGVRRTTWRIGRLARSRTARA